MRIEDNQKQPILSPREQWFLIVILLIVIAFTTVGWISSIRSFEEIRQITEVPAWLRP